MNDKNNIAENQAPPLGDLGVVYINKVDNKKSPLEPVPIYREDLGVVTQAPL
jgi:hypothetical protein